MSKADTAVGFIIKLGFSFLRAWMVMLAAGVLHTFFTVIPLIGFWESVIILLGLNALRLSFKGNS